MKTQKEKSMSSGIKTKSKNINTALVERIEKQLERGDDILCIVEDILEFEYMDVYDLIEQIPDSIVQKIKFRLAEKNYRIARKDFPELETEPLTDDIF